MKLILEDRSCEDMCVVANCLHCIDDETCLRCRDGYEMDDGGVCVERLECDMNCGSCEMDGEVNVCLECRVGYYKDLRGACIQCPKSCSSCV